MKMKKSLIIVLATIFALLIASCDIASDPESEKVVVVNDGTDTVYYSAMSLQQSYVVDPRPDMLRSTTLLPSIGPGFWAELDRVSSYQQQLGAALFVYRPALRNDTSLIVLDTTIQKTYADLLKSKYIRIP
jgi:hypothetical protein